GRRLEAIAKEPTQSLFGPDILQLFHSADFNIINLESPLTRASNEHKILKTGPHLKASPDTIRALHSLRINVATLANNHIYDYGDKGLTDTLEICEKNNIATVGAGISFAKASKVFFTTLSNIKIAIINIAENEWANASDKHGGANPMDIVANTKSICEAKSNADIVILIIHGGHEFYSYPSPRMVDQYRYYAEQGASIIVCHHAHCISGYEIYKNVPIFYGLGNFLFDADTNFQGWFEGIVISIEISAQKEITSKIHPYKQCSGNLKVELLRGNEKLEVENKIKAINSVIADLQRLKNEFNAFIDSNRKYILSIYHTSYFLNNKYFRSAIQRLGLERFFLRRSQLKSILNYSRCEALKDVSFEVLFNFLSKE
ncbi:MAG TPA: CapA family protein, partial [Chitinophagaceae bacterium]|nr:CapA family protein [Chitinophagaceae bacterium]